MVEKPAFHINSNIIDNFKYIARPVSPITFIASQKISPLKWSLEDFQFIAKANTIITIKI